MRRIFIVCILCIISFTTVRAVIWHKLCYIRDPLPAKETCESSLFPLKDFLSKPMHFIGVGSQCLVFAPKESPYVLKICKATRYQNFFSSCQRKQQRLHNDCENYEIAFSKLSEQTGIVYLHLHKTSSLKTKIQLIDPLHLPYKASADDLVFYIQKKAIPFSEYLQTSSDTEQRLLLSSLLTSIEEQTSLGVRIKDIHPLKNIGVVRNRPIWIDPGRMEKRQTAYSKEETEVLLDKMRSLLTPFFPDQEVDFF